MKQRRRSGSTSKVAADGAAREAPVSEAAFRQSCRDAFEEGVPGLRTLAGRTGADAKDARRLLETWERVTGRSSEVH